MIIFDVMIETAKYLKSKLPDLMLAPSVAHKYDIERFSACVGGTLINTNEVILHRNLFDWVWLDEWDRTGAENKKKTLYNRENFKKLRAHKFKIAVVSPELHASSPGLLGKEVHQDATNKKILHKRIKSIINLKPDVICTDYPELIKTYTHK